MLRIFLFFNATTLIWVFFRSPTADEALRFLAAMFLGGSESGWPVFPTLVVVACMGLHVAERRIRAELPALRRAAAERRWAPAVEGLAFGAIVGLSIAVAGAGGEFIYFQF